MNFLNKKRNFITSKLKFKSKEKITSLVYDDKNRGNEETLENAEIQSTLPFKEEDSGKKEFKEFISEKDLIRGLNPQKSYNKLTKIEPLPKEYKTYKNIKYTKFEKKHLKKIEKEKNKIPVSKKIEKWNFDLKYDKYQKLLTSLPEFNEMPRISGV